MAYLLTNGTYYITFNNNKYTACTHKFMACTWDKKEKAEKIAASSLCTALRKQGYVPVLVEDAPIAPTVQPEPAPVSPTAKQASVQSASYLPLGRTGVKKVDDIFQSFQKMAKTIGELGNMRKCCEDGVHHEEQIQTDLLHRIEFESGAKGNAAHLCSQLKACRNRRRAYKDMIAMIDDASITINPEAWRDYVSVKVKSLAERKYAPRSKEVFQKGT